MLTIRDFIYLDVERLKSMLSQMDKGLLDSIQSQISHQAGATAEGKGGIPLLFEARGEANYVFQNQHTQTRALHDYIYNIVEEKLRESDALIPIPGKYEGKQISSRESFVSVASSTSFVLIQGWVIPNRQGDGEFSVGAGGARPGAIYTTSKRNWYYYQ
jgi:hypothetical protein